MSFDPEKIERFKPSDWHDTKGGSAMRPSLKGPYVLYDDYAQLMTLLHDVSTDADPAGTVRENRMLQDKVAAQEVLIAELIAEVKKLRGEGHGTN